MPGRRPPGPPRGSAEHLSQPDASPWFLLVSFLPLVLLLFVGIIIWRLGVIRNRNLVRRLKVIEELEEERKGSKAVGKGKRKDDKVMVGFWHPYW
jgi:hypothetical protein